MSKLNKKYLLIITLILLISIGYVLLSPYFKTGGRFDNNYNGQDLDENYKKYEQEILDLKNYCEILMDDFQGLSFGFNERNDRFYIGVRIYNPNTKNVESFFGLNSFKLKSNHMDSIKEVMNWDNGELDTLILKLKASNCIDILKQPFFNKPISVGYRYGGPMGVAKYSYFLFNTPLNDSLIKVWDKKEGYKVYNDTVLFEYGYPL